MVSSIRLSVVDGAPFPMESLERPSIGVDCGVRCLGPTIFVAQRHQRKAQVDSCRRRAPARGGRAATGRVFVFVALLIFVFGGRKFILPRVILPGRFFRTTSRAGIGQGRQSMACLPNTDEVEIRFSPPSQKFSGAQRTPGECAGPDLQGGRKNRFSYRECTALKTLHFRDGFQLDSCKSHVCIDALENKGQITKPGITQPSSPSPIQVHHRPNPIS